MARWRRSRAVEVIVSIGSHFQILDSGEYNGSSVAFWQSGFHLQYRQDSRNYSFLHSRGTEMEFSRYELYNLLNRPGPLWLARADLKDVNLEGVNLYGAILRGT